MFVVCLSVCLSIYLSCTIDKLLSFQTEFPTSSLTFQVLDDATQTVAVGCDDDVLAGFDLGSDDVVPVGQGACDGVLQALACGQLTSLQALVAPRLVG